MNNSTSSIMTSRYNTTNMASSEPAEDEIFHQRVYPLNTTSPGVGTTISTVLKYKPPVGMHEDAIKHIGKLHTNSTFEGDHNTVVSTATVIGLSVCFCVMVMVVIGIICIRKRQLLKRAIVKNIPINFKRQKSEALDRAPLTSPESEPALTRNSMYLDDDIITRPLKSALLSQNHNAMPSRDDADDNSTDIRRFSMTSDVTDLELRDKIRGMSQMSLDETQSTHSNQDIDWDGFFSDEIYKKTDFCDSVTKQANAELSPGHDSGLDVGGLEDYFVDDEFDFEWSNPTIR